MSHFNKKAFFTLAGAFVLAWFAGKYLLGPAMPFLMGTALALAAEPVTRRLSTRLPRPGAAAIGVTLALILLGTGVVLFSALGLQALKQLGQQLPQLSRAAGEGLQAMEEALVSLARKSPPELQPVLSGGVKRLLGGGSGILDRLVDRLPGAAAEVLGYLPGSALTLGTGILAGFMVSFRLPKFRQVLAADPGVQKSLPLLRQVRTALGGWLKAQLQLAGVCFLIVGTGLTLLGLPQSILWAVIIALVDSVPLLGTGVVLIPWALVSLIQGHQARALGLAAVCVTAMVSRSVLEPRILGRQLGLDPLVTLLALYAGYRLWGFGGMLLAPVLCVIAREFSRQDPDSAADTGC